MVSNSICPTPGLLPVSLGGISAISSYVPASAALSPAALGTRATILASPHQELFNVPVVLLTAISSKYTILPLIVLAPAL